MVFSLRLCIVGMKIQRLRIHLRRIFGKQRNTRMGEKPTLASLKLFFSHHAHGHVAPIRMCGGGFSQHGASSSIFLIYKPTLTIQFILSSISPN